MFVFRKAFPATSSQFAKTASVSGFIQFCQTNMVDDESFTILLGGLSAALVPFRWFVHQFFWRAVPYCRCRSSRIVHVSKFIITEYFISMGVYAGISDSKKCFHSRLDDCHYCSQVNSLFRLEYISISFQRSHGGFFSHFRARMVEQWNHIRLFSNRVGLSKLRKREMSWSYL